MKILLPLLVFALVVSCQQTERTSTLIELNFDSLRSDYIRRFTDDSPFKDSLCNDAINLAKEHADKDIFRFYDMEGAMDSSHTPTLILRDELYFKILDGYNKNHGFRYCYNQAILNFYNDKYGFNPMDYIKVKYDSLFELGFTDEPPQFLGGDPLETLNTYFYCNMDLSDVELDSVSVYFKIDIKGDPYDIQLVESSGHQLDSVTFNFVRNMPTWKPARSNDGKPRSGWDYTFRFYYNEKLKKDCI